ncbi:MAG TPA: hypothetical protein VKO18_16365 [Terriglobia bacterium]|nr:hypothetical protein [Terriglobia bacterium]
MVRSISIAEYKVEQARFFLEQISQSELNFFAAQCFVDAFASACRSITLFMQAVINKVAGFKAWYAPRIELQGKDPLSQFFNDYRNVSIHIGDTVVRGGGSFIHKGGNRVGLYFFKSSLRSCPNTSNSGNDLAALRHIENISHPHAAGFPAPPEWPADTLPQGEDLPGR